MTPTEQDNELRKKIEKIPIAYSSDQGGEAMYFEDFGIMPSDIDDFYDELIKLITADRKRVALEVELQLLTYLLNERTEHMFMQNPDTGEITGNGWLCNTSLSAVSANRIEAERRKRIAELKAQQEEQKWQIYE